ncbi:MAG: hypothetical protein QW303_05640, partial [Nitrososphaerota archaeon]
MTFLIAFLASRLKDAKLFKRLSSTTLKMVKTTHVKKSESVKKSNVLRNSTKKDFSENSPPPNGGELKLKSEQNSISNVKESLQEKRSFSAKYNSSGDKKTSLKTEQQREQNISRKKSDHILEVKTTQTGAFKQTIERIASVISDCCIVFIPPDDEEETDDDYYEEVDDDHK